MTIEQQFKQLLDIACKNGFNNLFGKEINKSQIFAPTIYVNNTIDLAVYNKDEECYKFTIEFSLNDLILQTNFFECLFKNALPCFHTGNFQMTITQQYKFRWILEVEEGNPLEWLFKQFDL